MIGSTPSYEWTEVHNPHFLWWYHSRHAHHIGCRSEKMYAVHQAAASELTGICCSLQLSRKTSCMHLVTLSAWCRSTRNPSARRPYLSAVSTTPSSSAVKVATVSPWFVNLNGGDKVGTNSRFVCGRCVKAAQTNNIKKAANATSASEVTLTTLASASTLIALSCNCHQDTTRT